MESAKKIKKLQNQWEEFQSINKGPERILPYLKLNEELITKMVKHR